ncbi:MAG: peptide/nickel transport system permease protein [Thermomicrobiales bacterium]|nr:peptide/nickel transport system permease protein [Thermomicrobiales bacterium]MEA2584277.1 peptide/nickel transport system permease protein [Thermomicrobiales bacterium]MEA2594894.1 peptide/nickel transport system permease protein [Thermomicrobiales bacterium]
MSVVVRDRGMAEAAQATLRERRPPGFWYRFSRHRLAVLGMVFVAVIGLAALLAPWISPYDPYAMQLPEARLRPSLEHPLGTDNLGRDILTRVLVGGRVSIAVALAAVAISSGVGTVLGVTAGYRGGWVDSVIMRITDMFMSIPLFVLLIVLVSMLGPSKANVILIVGLLSWMGVARLVRGQVLSVMNELYIEAATASGAPSTRIVLRHVLPNSFVPAVVATTLGVANAMLWEAALSFLGLGIQPPTPSWGNMLNAAQQLQTLVREPWVWLGPGGAIALTVLSINFMGDGLRDALDPRARR